MEKSAGSDHGAESVLERHPQDDWALAKPRTVGKRMIRVLRTLIDAIIPSAPRIDSTVDDIARHALVSLQYMPRSSAFVLLFGMRMLNWSPLWRGRGFTPLTRLPRDLVRKHLLAVMQSRWLAVRLLMQGPLGLFMTTYFDQEYAHREIDYDPVPFVRARIALRKAWLEGTEPTERDEIHHLPVIDR